MNNNEKEGGIKIRSNKEKQNKVGTGLSSRFEKRQDNDKQARGRSRTRPHKNNNDNTVRSEQKPKGKIHLPIKGKSSHSLKVVPIGGLGEIGKNLTAFEYNNEILILDCGMSFPDFEMYGIDLVIPDFTYLIRNKKKIKGLIITHGHEDHIGAVPYLLKELSVPVYGAALPLGLIESKLVEHGLKAKLHKINAGETFKLGHFKIDAIRATHSIADALCFAIYTPAGTIFHTGDFKIDYTPVDGEPMDLGKLATVGESGVLLLMSDSTNATRPGFTESEKKVGDTLANVFRNTRSRIIIATFSSNVHRMQKIVDNAVLFRRKIVFNGRSMVKVAQIAKELGYLTIPAGIEVDIEQIKNIPDKELVIMTTGSQGEPYSALTRMAAGTHKSIRIKKDDLVVMSSSPVPGNEKLVANVVNKLFELEAKVLYSDIADIHVSGHACQEELKMMFSLIKPKYFMPVHGEFRHMAMHRELAIQMGIPASKILMMKNGDVLNISNSSAKIAKAQVPAEAIMVDGSGIGDIGDVVLNDRRILSESGIIIVSTAIDRNAGIIIDGPQIMSRGFVYVKENEHLIADLTKLSAEALEKSLSQNPMDFAAHRTAVRDVVRKHIYNLYERRPIILPIFLD
ncbi:MAG: ribonuclease J, partial [Anaerovoracaceae bacterium]